MRTPAGRVHLALVASSLALIPAAAATAATPPSVSTGGAARVTPTTATLTGKVNPRGTATSYVFQYGLTHAYGTTTVVTAVGSGTANVAAAADIGGLTPNTRYHYRIVASSKAGLTNGTDRTFTTRRQPLGLSLAATPNPVPYGAPATLSGNLSGTGNAGQTIVLQQNPFPFTGGLQPFGNAVVTDGAGNFSVALLSVPLTTQYRAVVDGKTVVSPILTVPVSVRVGTDVSRTSVRRGRKVRFTGSIHPARDGARVLVQKRSPKGRWVTVARTITRHRSAALSTFRRTIRVRRGGQYRVYVFLQDGNYTSGVGRTIVIHTHR